MLTVEDKRNLLTDAMRRTQPKPARRPGADASPTDVPQPVAIVGMSGAFPGCYDARSFWAALDADRVLIQAAPEDRPGPNRRADRPRYGGFLQDIAGFDARFFKITPDEAQLLDPRIRLLLMHAWRAVEDAAIAPAALKGKPVGVFIGAEGNEYLKRLQAARVPLGENFDQAVSMLANRISYAFDFRGPSEVVDTMCSGAAVALHRAVTALRTGEVDHALVGAANLLLDEVLFDGLDRMGQLSPTDTVHSFGAQASGYVRGEGVAVVLLKTLARAQADGDPIHAVIPHTAVNYNGAGGMSIAAPDIAAHADLIRGCLQTAGIDPRDLGYIEAQGMGNPLTDIAEWEAFNRALTALAQERGVTLKPQSCHVGTLKPMTGHLHAASALAALFKVVHSFKTRTLHKILNFTQAHPDLDTQNRPCALLTQTRPMPDACRVAGIHAFGSGGNNAHLLLRAADPAPRAEPAAQPKEVLVILSAVDEARLKIMAADLAHFLDFEQPRLDDLAYTLQVGRNAMKERVAFRVSTLPMLKLKLTIFACEEQQETDFWRGSLQTGAKASRLLTDDPDGRELIQRWIQTGRLPKLAELWTNGYDLDWAALYGDHTPCRIHLPTYWFADDPYWIPESAAPEEQPVADEAQTFLDGLTADQIQFLQENLIPEPEPQPQAAPEPAPQAAQPPAQPVVTAPAPQAAQPPAQPVVTAPAPQAAQPPAQPVVTAPDPSPSVPVFDIVTQLLAATLRLNPDQLDPNQTFADYGLNSINGARFMRQLEDALDLALPPRWMFDHPSISALSQAVSARRAAASSLKA